MNMALLIVATNVSIDNSCLQCIVECSLELEKDEDQVEPRSKLINIDRIGFNYFICNLLFTIFMFIIIIVKPIMYMKKKFNMLTS